jgi:hypothetical protein
MPQIKTSEFRDEVHDRMLAWRKWKSIHTWVFVLVGATSSAVATFVAANSRHKIICEKYAWIPATIAAILTFVISALGAQSAAKSFETGARLLEGGLAKFDSDPEFGDVKLGKTLANAVDALNRKS